MTAPSLISKQATLNEAGLGPSETRDLLDFSVMTDLRKAGHKKFDTGMTASETPSKLFESAAQLNETHALNRSRLDPLSLRYDSISTTQNYDLDQVKVTNPFNQTNMIKGVKSLRITRDTL